VKTYRTRMPRRQGSRECLLFRVYRNMRGRAHGNSTKSPWVYPLGWPWKGYDAFRTWALKSGFCKERPSPDRPRPAEPYSPTNVVWVPVKDNNGTARGRGYHGAQPPGPEPPLDDYVPF
jgi:hypothetical protein